MSSFVAGMAKADGVARFVAQRRVFSPRRKMMDFDFAAALAAVLARPIVALPYCISERLVSNRGEVGVACRSRAAFPMWMRGADEVRVARRFTADPLRSKADSCFVRCRQRAPGQRLRYVVPLRLRRDATRCCRFTTSEHRQFSGHIRTLGRICLAQVAPCCSARSRAELEAAATVRVSALVAYTLVELSHSRDIITWSSRC